MLDSRHNFIKDDWSSWATWWTLFSANAKTKIFDKWHWIWKSWKQKLQRGCLAHRLGHPSDKIIQYISDTNSYVHFKENKFVKRSWNQRCFVQFY